MTTEATPQTTPIETITPIKPSEALRLGRLVRPRKTAVHCFKGEDGACAVGAMAIGYGWSGPTTEEDNLNDEAVYSFVAERAGLDPTPASPMGTPLYDIWSRNDDADLQGRDPDPEVLAYLESRGL